MQKLKITPINIERAKTVNGIGKNISDVVDFPISTSNNINRVIGALNKVLPLISTPYDD